jgi:predicted RNA binding protein YcfA (HicA-like mRNA interferase family)
MPKLPRMSGQEAGAVFRKLGYKMRRIEGSHMIYKAPGRKALSIPNHGELDIGLLRRLIRDAGITPQEFVDLVG